jgi:hypothetical protein
MQARYEGSIPVILRLIVVIVLVLVERPHSHTHSNGVGALCSLPNVGHDVTQLHRDPRVLERRTNDVVR